MPYIENLGGKVKRKSILPYEITKKPENGENCANKKKCVIACYGKACVYWKSK